MSVADTTVLEGLDVFVVEDEPFVALNLEDMLEELGCNVVGPVARLDKAQELVTGDFAVHVAVLDVNLAGELVFPLAQTLAERGVPIVFATGYGHASLPDEWRNRPTLQKPYVMDDVEASLRHALSGLAG